MNVRFKSSEDIEPTNILHRSRKAIKIQPKHKRLQIMAKKILKTNGKPADNTLPKFKTFYKVVLAKQHGTSTNTDT